MDAGDAVARATAEEHPLRAAAFRILFESGKPVPAGVLAAELGWEVGEVEAEAAGLEGEGLIRRDAGGGIVGAVGLSVVASSSEVQVAGRTFWCWCAKTALGVLAALGRGGRIVAHSPSSGRELHLAFEGSRPVSTELVVFWPGSEFAAGCGSVVDELCPNINFFEGREAAESWARTNGVSGEVISIDEATTRSVGKWAPLLAPVRLPAEPAGAMSSQA